MISRSVVLALLLCGATRGGELRLGKDQTPADWRAERRLVDMHLHLNYTREHLTRAVKIMDGAGIGIGVNLSGGTVTAKDGGPSEFERNKKLADEMFPGRFVHYMNLDYTGWDEPDFARNAAKQIEEGHRLGAAGLKEFKRLGLYLRDKNKNLIRVDDPKLDAVWKRCGELGMPISIHVADPKAFWEPYDDRNERWVELKDHRNWWFGDPAVYPPRMEIVNALGRVIERHPETTFVCVHFANNAEDIDWVERELDRLPNMMADIAARVPEIGRHDPAKVRRLFSKHSSRIVFGTDFQVYDRLILGSGGSGPGPSDADAKEFFEKHWRWFETDDRKFAHMTPIQGDWTIDAIGLDNDSLRRVYFDNARKLLARSMPAPVCLAVRARAEMDGISDADWSDAPVQRMELGSLDGGAHPGSGTAVRARFTDENLYLRYDAPFTELTTFEPARLNSERQGLWDRDVVEAFIAADPSKPRRYLEFEVAPTNEKLDLAIDPEIPQIQQRLAWDSGFVSWTRRNQDRKTWTTVMRIPLASLSQEPVRNGSRWRINFYRIDRAGQAFLAWNPTLTRTFHTPDRFAWLEFRE